MKSSAAPAKTAFEPSRPWVIGAVLLCAVGTLGTVVVAASPGHESGSDIGSGIGSEVGRAAGFADVFRIHPGLVSVEAAAVIAGVTVAGIAALWWSPRRAWPWLLVMGVVLTIPGEFVDLMSPPEPIHPRWPQETAGDRDWLIYGSVTAGAQLALLGTLGAGLRLVHIGAAGVGAVLVGAGLGAQVFGASTDVRIVELMLLRPGVSASGVQSLLHDGMLLAAVGGALLVMMLYRRYDGRPELAAPSSRAEPAMGRGTALVGAVAAAVFVPAAFIGDDEFDVAASALLLAAGLVAALIAGRRAFAGTAVASAVVVGISGPTDALIQSAEPIGMWFWIAVGVAAGAAAAFPSWRRWTAVGACGLCGAALAVTMVIRPDETTVLMLALLAAGTAAIGSLGVWLARDGRLPVVLGPLVFATVTGGCSLLAHWQGPERRGTGDDLFREPGHLWVYTALLLAAAVAFAALERLRARPRSD
ncbi:hypothetical protein [Spirillospora sp. NPDC048823]|uniref:hypothetical protein n=1 Tax=unclassified Spirillospora TaxID=2642701 RepID=UPI00371BE570